MRTAIAGFVYRGTGVPELQGKFVYGDTLGNIWALFHDEVGTPVPQLLFSTNVIRNFAEDADGEIIALKSGSLGKIVAGGPPPPNDFPQMLADTGCFDSISPPGAGVGRHTLRRQLAALVRRRQQATLDGASGWGAHRDHAQRRLGPAGGNHPDQELQRRRPTRRDAIPDPPRQWRVGRILV